MIKNIPKPDRFEKLGLECLWKSFEMLFNISNNVNALIQDEIFDNYEITIEDYWKHNGITVSTSLIVLFQGVEYLMKSKITEKSALLLIENNKYDWPSLPNKTDRNFDELQTISGENLLGVFCAVLPQNFPILAFVGYNGDIGSSPLLVVKTERILHVSSISQTPLYHTSAS